MNDATCSGLIECLWEFQTLATGFAGTVVAGLTAYAIYHAARLPVDADREVRKESERRRLHLRSLELSQDLTIIGKRAKQGQGTVIVHKAANAPVTDEIRKKMFLRIPQPTRDWEFMSLIDETTARQCINLNGMIEDHNFDVQRAGGAFGDNNFGQSIKTRLDTIYKLSSELAQLILRN